MTRPFEMNPSRMPARDYPSEPRQTAICAADHQLFARFMVHGYPATPSGTRGLSPAADAGLIQAVADQLLPYASGGGQWPMQFVIELARRGRVHVSARYERRVWAISLEAEQVATSQWLTNQQQVCQQSLARTLGQSVRVQVIPERQA